MVLKEHAVKYKPVEHTAPRSMQHENTRKEVILQQPHVARQSKTTRDVKNRAPKNVSIRVSASSSVSENQEQAEQQSMSLVRKSLLFLCAVGVAYLLYLVFSGQLDEFIEALQGVNTDWVIYAMLCYVVYYILGVSAYIIAVIKDPHCPVGIRDLMSVEASGIFFYNLTPNGAGGPPSQIFRLTRAGLSIAQAGALEYTRFIMYEAGEGIFAALMMIFRGHYFFETYGDVFYVGAALFLFKILQVFGLLAVCLWPQSIAKVGKFALKMLSHIGYFRKTSQAWSATFEAQITEFSHGFKSAAKNIPEMLLTLLITLFQLGCLYALPWFVLKAFGLPADLLTCLACGSMLELLTSAVPLPGGTLGAEGGFAFLFMPMFGVNTAAGYVVWRMVEYFLPVLAAVPLLGLRSTHQATIHARWTHLEKRVKRLAQRGIKEYTSPHSDGVRIAIHSKTKSQSKKKSRL